MLRVPRDVYAVFEDAMDAADVVRGARSSYLKWLRYYWDFAGEYGHDVDAAETLPAFVTKLASKGQSTEQLEQASQAVRLYQGMGAGPSAGQKPTMREPIARYSARSGESFGSPSEGTIELAGDGRAVNGPPGDMEIWGHPTNSLSLRALSLTGCRCRTGSGLEAAS